VCPAVAGPAVGRLGATALIGVGGRAFADPGGPLVAVASLRGTNAAEGSRARSEKGGPPHRAARSELAYFTFAEGVEPGAEVRYAGGPRVGRVEHTRLDPRDPSHVEITFGVRPDVPVKTDSVVKILSLSALGDYHVEIMPGSAQAPMMTPLLAASGRM